ncbi:hypothetical protein BO94DRAFT_470732 [Aspergillus sclerotioniger CBS 115572]|uniref:Uncharacterized protein n=1 Tax=Aspergillus sclerotioniger CBS 115572 TaxID=1450535 RepID=A0A317W497_9EURO|nr:hypothetical protein BO94DRAFT_470732 [Aspergillus sclerotioniger CBS 115572]PWY80799.1 hypothetical protein BO94DRAFT_470732 [Aspergillus sclerotioniger CBS 115572]
MSPTSKLYVAIYNAEGIYKHWNIFIDGPTAKEKIILQAMGSSTRYRFDESNYNARESPDLLLLVYLCHVQNSSFGAIRDAAREVVIHNEFPGYNCQDYVLELLDLLEKKGLVDGADEGYKCSKQMVVDEQEGLV